MKKFDFEVGEDRVNRARTQMKSLCTMLAIYLQNADEGTTDTVPYSTLGDYVWQLQQNLEAIEQGMEEMREGEK